MYKVIANLNVCLDDNNSEQNFYSNKEHFNEYKIKDAKVNFRKQIRIIKKILDYLKTKNSKIKYNVSIELSENDNIIYSYYYHNQLTTESLDFDNTFFIEEPFYIKDYKRIIVEGSRALQPWLNFKTPFDGIV